MVRANDQPTFTDANNIVSRVGCDWLRHDHHQQMRQLYEYGSIGIFFGAAGVS
jgi:hypothetical protein